MAKVILTTELDYNDLSTWEQEWVYNCLDCCNTVEIWQAIYPNATQQAKFTYNFVKGLQAPAMTMSMRGLKIDVARRAEWITSLTRRINKLENNLNKLAYAVWRKPLNAKSPAQLKKFFYEVMQLPEQFKYDPVKKDKVLSCDNKALKELSKHLLARPIVRHILKIRELSKKLGTIKTPIDADERMRTSYNVCGTITGRWSSNANCFDTGTNLQNITPELREMFIADEGKKLAYIDLEQAESRAVAYLSGDESYIEACEGGDLHTLVTRMVWSDLDWTGDLEYDRHEIASQECVRNGSIVYSYRDMAKRGGHGTNYLGTPHALAMVLGVTRATIEAFQDKYFKAFPKIKEWHLSIAETLQTTGRLSTPIGRERLFLKRLFEDKTLKEAVAFVPQSTVAELLNEGMYRVWTKFEQTKTKYPVQVLAQIHDAILIQYDDINPDYERELLENVRKTLEVPLDINGRTMVIPANIEGTGWNWGKHSITNEDGLKHYDGNDKRQRKRQANSRKSDNILRVLL